jgi:1-deoxy-D-xylulose-5-phosphate reductoisomerase
VDSEHSAIFQALRGEDRQEVSRILLTASGGPFIDLSKEELCSVTPEDALKHPTWEMGSKITIDSATMMNKALEIIEARWLFGIPAERIEVVVHRQSIVHSMVEYIDGSIIGQMGTPDMKVPIRFALTYPERSRANKRYFDIEKFSCLSFEPPDLARFPAVSLGFRAALEGGITGAVLNASNERAVDLFLKGDISFDEITGSVKNVMDRMTNKSAPTLEDVFSADQWARKELDRCISH